MVVLFATFASRLSAYSIVRHDSTRPDSAKFLQKVQRINSIEVIELLLYHPGQNQWFNIEESYITTFTEVHHIDFRST